MLALGMFTVHVAFRATIDVVLAQPPDGGAVEEFDKTLVHGNVALSLEGDFDNDGGGVVVGRSSSRDVEDMIASGVTDTDGDSNMGAVVVIIFEEPLNEAVVLKYGA